MTDVSAESPVTAGTWPDGAYEAVDRWRQGHVLDGVPLVALGAAHALPFWAAGRPTGGDVAGLPVLAVDPPSTGKAMVVSQGCDLVKQAFPFVTVVPVYEASQILSPDQQANARSGGTWHLVHLTSDWAASGFWVADLRLETAIDKSFLVPAVPAEAFAARPATRSSPSASRPAGFGPPSRTRAGCTSSSRSRSTSPAGSPTARHRWPASERYASSTTTRPHRPP